MFKTVSKRNVRILLNKLNIERSSNIQVRDVVVFQKIKQCQAVLQKFPLSMDFKKFELEATMACRLTHNAYMSFLSHKAKLYRS